MHCSRSSFQICLHRLCPITSACKHRFSKFSIGFCCGLWLSLSESWICSALINSVSLRWGFFALLEVEPSIFCHVLSSVNHPVNSDQLLCLCWRKTFPWRVCSGMMCSGIKPKNFSVGLIWTEHLNLDSPRPYQLLNLLFYQFCLNTNGWNATDIFFLQKKKYFLTCYGKTERTKVKWDGGLHKGEQIKHIGWVQWQNENEKETLALHSVQHSVTCLSDLAAHKLIGDLVTTKTGPFCSRHFLIWLWNRVILCKQVIPTLAPQGRFWCTFVRLIAHLPCSVN